MRVFVATPPTPVVTWEEADAHLKLDGDTDQQAEVEAMIAAATGHIDGPMGWLGRAIGVQTLEARVDHLDDCARALPYPPVIETVEIKYLDPAGTLQTLAADQYELIGNSLVTAWQGTWPATLARSEAVRVRYRAGYEIIPPPIRAAILLMLGDLYRNRDTVAAGTVTASAVPMSTTVTALLAPYRVYA
jgi:uncharacterized phiE125 gp8 family phage protein